MSNHLSDRTGGGDGMFINEPKPYITITAQFVDKIFSFSFLPLITKLAHVTLFSAMLTDNIRIYKQHIFAF